MPVNPDLLIAGLAAFAVSTAMAQELPHCPVSVETVEVPAAQRDAVNTALLAAAGAPRCSQPLRLFKRDSAASSAEGFHPSMCDPKGGALLPEPDRSDFRRKGALLRLYASKCSRDDFFRGASRYSTPAGLRTNHLLNNEILVELFQSETGFLSSLPESLPATRKLREEALAFWKSILTTPDVVAGDSARELADGETETLRALFEDFEARSHRKSLVTTRAAEDAAEIDWEMQSVITSLLILAHETPEAAAHAENMSRAIAAGTGGAAPTPDEFISRERMSLAGGFATLPEALSRESSHPIRKKLEAIRARAKIPLELYMRKLAALSVDLQGKELNEKRLQLLKTGLWKPVVEARASDSRDFKEVGESALDLVRQQRDRIRAQVVRVRSGNYKGDYAENPAVLQQLLLRLDESKDPELYMRLAGRVCLVLDRDHNMAVTSSKAGAYDSFGLPLMIGGSVVGGPVGAALSYGASGLFAKASFDRLSWSMRRYQIESQNAARGKGSADRLIAAKKNVIADMGEPLMAAVGVTSFKAGSSARAVSQIRGSLNSGRVAEMLDSARFWMVMDAGVDAGFFAYGVASGSKMNMLAPFISGPFNFRTFKEFNEGLKALDR